MEVLAKTVIREENREKGIGLVSIRLVRRCTSGCETTLSVVCGNKILGNYKDDLWDAETAFSKIVKYYKEKYQN